MSRTKKSKAVPIVAVLTFLIAALAVVCFLINPLVIQPQKDAIAKANADARAAVEERNRQAEAEYQARIAEMESEAKKPTNPSWPAQNPDAEWELLDLTTIPLENQTAEARTRADLMTGGMLLVNAFHSRPADFDESGVVSVAKAFKGDDKIQAKDNNVTLFPNAVNALHDAIVAAKAEGMQHYLVEEGYRTYETQETYFNNKVTKLSSKYTGQALLDAAMKEVNYPGTSEYNSGLAFELRLHDKSNPEVSAPKYSTTPEAKWMNENCWKYGIVFRFPLSGWPLESSTDKSFKTAVSKKLNLYRYVGKGNAAIMHYMDFTMEEYIEYLEEHPHVALFVDGVLKYEVYRQPVGDAESINVQLTRNSTSHESSLDNMGAVITVFNY
ncbi:MAG: M15 family metallopeptidase [Clostridia bacterium]|nr:M15 family metallopeptidase [Clostridia bacterium]